MPKSLPVLCALLSSFVLLGFAKADSAAPEYSLTVALTSEGISATCEAGCAWKTLDAQFPQELYRITDRGVFVVQTPTGRTSRDEEAIFSFLVERSNGGISATCETGCAWTRLSARTPSQVYRLDQSGVRP